MIRISSSAKNIGARATVDVHMDMKMNANCVTWASYHRLTTVWHIRHNVTQDCAETLTHTFISSKLDNLNGKLTGLPGNVLKKIQLVQNNAVTLVLKKRKGDLGMCLLHQLHWIPIKSRIKFKIYLMTFKALNGFAPPYISSLLTRYEPTRTFHSACIACLWKSS